MFKRIAQHTVHAKIRTFLFNHKTLFYFVLGMELIFPTMTHNPHLYFGPNLGLELKPSPGRLYCFKAVVHTVCQ